MFGAFIVTPDDEVAFSQIGDHRSIQEFHFFIENRTVAVIFTDGEIEKFTEPLTENTAHALKNASQILVADIDDDRQLLREYYVPVVELNLQE